VRRTSTPLIGLLGLVLAFALLTPVTALAAPSVGVAPTAKLVAGGESVLAKITVACDEGTQVLEAHLRISQDNQTVSGESTPGALRCDGRPHKYNVRVTPLEGAFHAGEATASAFVLLLDPSTGTTEQAQHSRTITIS
jgi:hypothetical protein